MPEEALNRADVREPIDADFRSAGAVVELDPGAVELDPGRIERERLVGCQLTAPLVVVAASAEARAISRVSRASQVMLAGGGGTDMGTGIEAAAALRPRPSIAIVLTDGFTPWPSTPPRGVRVIVGLLDQGRRDPRWQPPDWARTVLIEP